MLYLPNTKLRTYQGRGARKLSRRQLQDKNRGLGLHTLALTVTILEVETLKL